MVSSIWTSHFPISVLVIPVAAIPADFAGGALCLVCGPGVLSNLCNLKGDMIASKSGLRRTTLSQNRLISNTEDTTPVTSPSLMLN